MSAIIEVDELSKSFDGLKAVDGLSFTVYQGDVYGFLGQNGAGKSTTIRMLLTLIRPDNGKIRIMGKDLETSRNEILRLTGAIIEKPDLYKYLTAEENLKVFARLSGIKPSAALLKEKLALVGLSERAKSKVRTFSQGMKQRLGIAVALIHDPALIILDEPTNGLDPQGIADMRKLILSLSRDHGKTLVVSSHMLTEMEQVATRMIIIDRGRKIVEGEMKELLDPNHVILEIETTDIIKDRLWIEGSSWADKIIKVGNGALQLKLQKAEVPVFTSALAASGAGIISLRPQNTLEEYFLSLTSKDKYVAAGQN
jgi:ABC-type multidrug transport system ATPase subunit